MCFSEDYYTPTVDVLRLRDAPGLKGIIRFFGGAISKNSIFFLDKTVS